MSTKFNMTKDISGYNGFGLISTTDGYSGLLGQNVADSVTTPSNDIYHNYLAVFSYSPGSNVFVDFTTTASVPAGAIAADSSRLLPAARQVKSGDVISFITPDIAGAYITIEFYVVANYIN
jgi:hypothetical protein